MINSSTRPSISTSTSVPFTHKRFTCTNEAFSFCKSTNPSISTSSFSKAYGIPVYLAAPSRTRKRASNTGTRSFPYIPFKVPLHETSPAISALSSLFKIVSGTRSSSVFNDGIFIPKVKSTANCRFNVSPRNCPPTPNFIPFTFMTARSNT